MTETETQLLTALAAEARGPKRNGLFALWLVARTAEAILPPDAVELRSHRRRVELLQRRLSSVSVPTALRRALPAAFRHIADGTPRAAALALHQLVAPTREAVSPHAADVLGAAAARARRHATDGES
ncbi:MAG: hypothetical protein OEW06_13575 [Gemmatimonadota bacterium]|nr:hypothetical protein [Gemmatimonadota bacterium]MDH4351620.1 hypothetical protein [Gemmatimonadota bacterium]